MAKEKERREKEKSLLVGLAWSCADMKLLLVSLFLLCSLATALQLLPSLAAAVRPSLLFRSSCLLSSDPHPQNLSSAASSPPLLRDLSKNEEIGAGADAAVVRRAFHPIGSAAYLFVQMGAYRGGPDTFAVVGLASKPLHVFAKPQFGCRWFPHGASASAAGPNGSMAAASYNILPDWGYGRVYTVVVVNCTFPSPVGADHSGGRLVLHATTGGGGDRAAPDEGETFVVLSEAPGTYNATAFTAPPKYKYLYCGSPLYGNLSPARVREWMAYHARLFGPQAHFVIHDAGGVHAAVREVLRPWIDRGLVTLQDVREQERFDGYYHNQFLVVNDCLHRYRFAAKWIFFFDVDEFIYVEQGTTLDSLLATFEDYSQFTIEQMPMSTRLCHADDAGKTTRMWGFEKLVYRDVKRGIRRDRKYAIQPRNAFATGVHMSQNVAGKSLHKTEGRIKYFHYHGTISHRREPCAQFANATEVAFDRTPYVLDTTLRRIAGSVKRFELKTIGTQLARTRQ